MIRVFISCPNCGREATFHFRNYNTTEIQSPYCSNCASVLERVIAEVAA